MRNKYRAIKTIVDGIKFDSKKEAMRYVQLKLLVKSGVISGLKLQPRFDITINDCKCGFYKADFEYIENNKTVIEDVKGMKTPVYNLKKKLIKAIYGIEIFET